MIFKNIKALKSQKFLPLLLCGISLGILFIFLSSQTSNGEKNTAPAEESFDHQKYAQQLEERLCSAISSVQGVGRVKVMITLKETFEKVYINDEELDRKEQDDQKSVSSKKELVLKNDGSSKQSPVLLKQIYPEILGVAVVCSGDVDAETEKKIISLCKTVFDLPSNRIFVTGGK